MPTGGSDNSLQSALEPYTTPLPGIVNKYEQNMQKGGFLDLPSFMEMFNSWKTLGEREAGRQSAAINESFGSQGARYGSDLLASQGRVRENLYDQLLNKGAEYQSGLRQQQYNELSGLVKLQADNAEAGMTRYFQDFLRRTSPPPGYGALQEQGQQYGLPGYIA